MKPSRLPGSALALLFVIALFALSASAESVIATIPVASPAQVAVNYVTQRVYVADTGGYPDGGGRVRVIDERANQVTATIVTTGNTSGVAVNFVTNRVYATDIDHGLVDVIDGRTNQVTATVPVADSTGLAAVNVLTGKIYVRSRFQNTVQVIDGSTNTVTATLSVPAPEDIALNEVTNQIYVASNTGFHSGNVAVIDGDADQVVATIHTADDSQTVGVAVNLFTNTIYATNSDSGVVVVIDGASNTISATTGLGQRLTGAGVNILTGRVYALESPFSDPGAVAVIDPETLEVLSTVPVGGLPQKIGIDPFRRRAYVSNFLGHTVSVIDLRPGDDDE